MKRILCIFRRNPTEWVGPPHSLSNIRPVKFEDNVEKDTEYHVEREKLVKFNHDFWLEHNRKFTAFGQQKSSTFYKEFLDSNYNSHVKYNFEWYSRNFKLLLLSYKLQFINIKRRLNDCKFKS